MLTRQLPPFVLILLCACASTPRSITVSAAANLQPAFTEIGAAFEKQTGMRVIFNFGATGQLGQQIAQGAPVDLFAAADRATVDGLAARGQLVLCTRADFPLLVNHLTPQEQAQQGVRRRNGSFVRGAFAF